MESLCAQLELARATDRALVRERFQRPQLLRFESKRYDAAAYQRIVRQQWLDDQTMYEYQVILGQRAHVQNSFFWPKLREGKFKQALGWFKAAPLYPHLVCFPINLDNTHWVALGVDFQKKVIVFSDSMGRLNKQIVSKVLEFVGACRKQLEPLTKCQIDGNFTVVSRDQCILASVDPESLKIDYGLENLPEYTRFADELRELQQSQKHANQVEMDLELELRPARKFIQQI